MKDVSHLYGEAPRKLFEDYIHSDLERIAEIGNEEHLKILEVSERRAVRYYFQHRRGETVFSTDWLPHIESAIARINQFDQAQANKRLVIFDNCDELYWSGLGIYQEPWSKTKARALLFKLSERFFLENLCDRSNKSLGRRRRFVIMEIDASKRLAKDSL